MKKFHCAILALSVSSLLCFSSVVAAKGEPRTWSTDTISVVQQNQVDPSIRLTMEQIMADPDWLGRQPESAFWAPDSSTVFYQRKREQSELRDWFRRPVQGVGNGEQVKLADWHQMGAEQLVFNADRSKMAYIFEGNLFVIVDGKLQQLTRSNSRPQFFLVGRLAYQQGWDFFAYDFNNGSHSEIASLKTEDAPTAPAPAKGYLGQEQAKLIRYIALQQQNQTERYQAAQQLRTENNSMAPAAIYLGKGQQIVDASLSPKGDFLMLATRKSSARNDKDIMPNYITANGDIAAQQVRAR
ncbi:MAG: S9 family peptidase, partial [Alishewanella sp.]|nr:S9 family peptidase [Alishewanella sp.]